MQDVEDVIKVFAAKKQEDEKSTKDKKAKSKPDKKKPTGRKKVKMRSKRERLLTVCVEFPRRSHGKKKGPRNKHPRHKKNKRKTERNEAEIQHADKRLFSEWNSRPV